MTRQGEPDGGGFLSRWSRLKQETKNEDIAAPPPSETALPVEIEDAQGASAEELPLPSLDDITPGADVAAFFQKHVPEALRTAALRKLWVTDPEIKGFIEMADYQWDFNNPDSIPGWSSTLKGVDVKAMAERIFNTAAADPRQSDAVDASQGPAEGTEQTAEDKSGGRIEDLRNSTDSSTISDASDVDSSDRTGAASEDVAVQNNASGSSSYAFPRKRHGGALPT
jgi:Protein of unknown function (DUF3306)